MDVGKLQQLFAQTLSGDYYGDQPWEGVTALQQLGTREVFDFAADWCKSFDPLRRARGIDVIAQIGKTAEHPSNRFPEEAFSVASELVQLEKEIRPLSSAIFALGHIGNERAVPLAIRHQAHPSADVRYAVAFALGAFPNHAESITTLLRLTADADPQVRDWSTFGLGVLGDADTQEIRDGLASRLSDSDQDAREEAIVGLAKRLDRRTLQPLVELLNQPNYSYRALEAASLMLGIDQDGPELDASQYLQMLQERFL